MKEKHDSPEIDESLLTAEQKEEMSRKGNWLPWVIFFGIIAALMIVCLVVLFTLK